MQICGCACKHIAYNDNNNYFFNKNVFFSIKFNSLFDFKEFFTVFIFFFEDIESFGMNLN